MISVRMRFRHNRRRYGDYLEMCGGSSFGSKSSNRAIIIHFIPLSTTYALPLHQDVFSRDLPIRGKSARAFCYQDNKLGAANVIKTRCIRLKWIQIGLIRTILSLARPIWRLYTFERLYPWRICAHGFYELGNCDLLPNIPNGRNDGKWTSSNHYCILLSYCPIHSLDSTQNGEREKKCSKHSSVRERAIQKVPIRFVRVTLRLKHPNSMHIQSSCANYVHHTARL